MAGRSTDVIVLLRAINVGGRNKLPMADLRAIANDAGFADASTYLQSGNMVLREVAVAKASRLARELHDAIDASTGLDIGIITRTAGEWQAIIDRNPFPDAAQDGTKLHVIVLDGPASNRLAEFDDEPFAPDELGVSERELYLSLPNGIGRSKLAVAVNRLDNAKSGTARNWKTVLALAAMVAGGD